MLIFLYFSGMTFDFFPLLDILSRIPTKIERGFRVRKTQARKIILLGKYSKAGIERTTPRRSSAVKSIVELFLKNNWSGRADLNGRSGHLTLSAAWQKVAPYSSRRHPPAPRRSSAVKSIVELFLKNNWSGRADLNGRPPAPKAGALTRLRYAPTALFKGNESHRNNQFPITKFQTCS